MEAKAITALRNIIRLFTLFLIWPGLNFDMAYFLSLLQLFKQKKTTIVFFVQKIVTRCMFCVILLNPAKKRLSQQFLDAEQEICIQAFS